MAPRPPAQVESRVHRIVPELILENHRAGRTSGAFRAAGMFLDVSGFSTMTDALMGHGRVGAEILASTMREVFDPLVETVLGQGGFVVGYAGDSVTALYPVETDEPSAARRAAAAALVIQSQLKAGKSLETRSGTFPITARIGLAMGSVEWSILSAGDGRRATFYFRGDAIESAALAQRMAARGEIVLTAALRACLPNELETTPLQDMHRLDRITVRAPSPRKVELPDADPEAAALFAPREVITRDLQGEFRQTVHAFIRLPALTQEQLRRFMDTFFALQERYGGLLEGIDFGDKGCNLLMIWGAPVAQENDIERALSFLLDLRNKAGVAIAAGMTYYTSYAGYVGARSFESYTAYGWGISMAARFMTEAAEGEIWIDERIVARVKDRFDVEFSGERSFKGFAQKQGVYRLRGRKSTYGMRFRGELVGRQSELEALESFTAPLWNGKYAGVLGIWGEAGIGKSRLVHEFRLSPMFRERACLWALCQTDQVLRRSLNPIRHWLTQYFEIGSTQTASGQELISSRLRDLADASGRDSVTAELKRAVPFLAALVEVDVRDPFYDQLDSEGRYDNTINSLSALLRAESLRQPFILLVEDAHYLDEDTKSFIARLKRALAADPIPHPIAILLTTRWEGTKVLLEEGLIDQDLDVGPLDDGGIADLSAQALGGRAAAPLAKMVNERAEGNPLYAEQILLYLKEQDLVEEDSDGAWNLRGATDSSSLPVDVSAMLVARLDRLNPRVKEVVQSAAVLGRVFDTPVLERMLSGRAGLGEQITAAEHAAVWSPIAERRYMFDHELLRDVAYNMQLVSRRRELHSLAFEALQDWYGASRHQHFGALAYHAEQAGRVQDALDYLKRAGDAARDGYHNARALDYYGRAIALIPAGQLEGEFVLRKERAQLISEYGTTDQRIRELEAMQELADSIAEPARRAEVLLLRSRLMISRGYYDNAEKTAERAGQLASEAGRTDLMIQAGMGLLDAAYQEGEYASAIEHGERALRLAREEGASTDEASILNKLGMAYLEMKNPSAAREYFEKSRQISRDGDDIRGIARVLTNLGSVAGYQGNYATAFDNYDQALRLAREFGSRKGETILHANLAWVSSLLGDHEATQNHAHQGIQIAREIGDQVMEIFCLIHLSSQAAALGDFEGAVQHAQKALTLASQSKQRNLQAWSGTYLGHALLDSDKLEEAREAYRESLQLRRDLEQAALATEPEAALAWIAIQQADEEAARSHVDSVLGQLDEDATLEGTDHPIRVYLHCHLVLKALRDPRAQEILRTAHLMLKTRADGIPDATRRQMYLEKVPYNRDVLALWAERRAASNSTSSRPPDRPH